MRFLSIALLAAFGASGADSRWIGGAQKENGTGHAAVVQASDLVFPHIPIGGGWKTTLVIANIGTEDVEFDKHYFSQTGRPMAVTFRNPPFGDLTVADTVKARLAPGRSYQYDLMDTGQPLQVGWAALTYESSKGRLAGYAHYRQSVAGKPDVEALVSLSAIDDSRFYMPFDNSQGFSTAIALANPDPNFGNAVTFRLLARDGTILYTGTVTLAPGYQTAFMLGTQFPQLAGQVGILQVEGSASRLSAIGLRFNPAAGNSFTTVPIMSMPEPAP